MFHFKRWSRFKMNEKLQDSIPTVHRTRQRRTTKGPTSLDECTRFTEWLINVTFNSSYKRYHYYFSYFLPSLSLSLYLYFSLSISFKNLFYFLLYNNFSFFFRCSRIKQKEEMRNSDCQCSVKYQAYYSNVHHPSGNTKSPDVGLS